MPTALIYSPGFDGHRQVYVFVFTHILKGLGYKIVIAGFQNESFENSFYLSKIRKDPSISFIDTKAYHGNGLSITHEEFLNLQEMVDADLTIFTEADNHISLLSSQTGIKAKKFKGRISGIFLRPFFFYQKRNWIDRLKYLKNLPSNWRTDAEFFHSRLLKHCKIMDSALYIDEKFAGTNTKVYTSIPDVFQQYAESLLKESKPEDQEWVGKLDEFLLRNPNRFVLFYFGTAQVRRGYEQLIRLAVNHNACFIHCGLQDEKATGSKEIHALKQKLKDQDRLFETNQYLSDPACIERFFRSATHIVLPYQNFPGSSGIMMQSLEYGIPVLVPDYGIIGYRVKKHKVGLTYNPQAPNDLELRFKEFIQIEPSSFKKNIDEFMSSQSVAKLQSTLVKSITGN